MNVDYLRVPDFNLFIRFYFFKDFYFKSSQTLSSTGIISDNLAPADCQNECSKSSLCFIALSDATKCYLKGSGSATPTACDATTCQAFSCKTSLIY